MLPVHDENSFILTGLDAGEIIRALSPKPLPIAATDGPMGSFRESPATVFAAMRPEF